MAAGGVYYRTISDPVSAAFAPSPIGERDQACWPNTRFQRTDLAPLGPPLKRGVEL